MIGRDQEMRAPRHPRIEQRSLVLWAGDRAGVDLTRLERDAIGAVALPLRHAAAETALVARAQTAGLGIVLPGQAHLNQLPAQARGRGFAALPYAQPAPIDPQAQRLGDAALADYAELFVDAQLGAGATLVTTPAHVFEAELGHGREQDLALVHASLAAWRERQGWRPPPQRPDEPARALYAAIAVRADELERAAAALVRQYGALDVDGFWVTVFGLGDADGAGAAGASAPGGSGGDPAAARRTAVQLAALTELALGLQESSGRPVAVSGAGAVHAALLASGVAATCTGALGTRPGFPPRAADDDGVTGIAVAAYHSAIVGTVPLGAAFEEARTWLFAAHPCRCGEHPAYEPPRGRAQTVNHNAWCLAAEVRDATRLLPVMDETRLAARLDRADRVRARLELDPLGPAWTAVAHAARARRAGGTAVSGDAVGFGA